MIFTSALVALLAVTGVYADTQRYPVCPENYDTYCCMTITPYSHSCRGGRCTQGPGWSCLVGVGKVESMKYCMKEVGGNKSPYCKRPGYEYFGSPLKWSRGSFEPMLQPSDYRHYIRPGMHKPWVPAVDEIKWEEETSDEVDTELRKRDPEHDVDME